MRPRRSFACLAFASVVVACSATPAGDDAAADEQALTEMAPIVGHLDDTTPGADFHAEELEPAQFPFAWSGDDFPRSKAIAATLGVDATLPPGLANRALVYTFAPGAEIEVCAESASAKAKLWLYTTTQRLSSYCKSFTCNDPDELDETPRAKNVGDKVCTHGRIPAGSYGPHYVVVNLGPGSANATATVTTRAIKLRPSTATDAGPFSASSCQGATLTVADLEARGLARGAVSQSVGTYDTIARTRSCNRFRGCTAWQAVDTGSLTLHGSCADCIPGEWTNVAKHGSVFVGWDDVSFGPYAKVMLYPDGTAAGGAAAWSNHVSCDLSLSRLPSCEADGDWNNWLTIGSTNLGFADAKESAFTKTCVRTVARPSRPKLASEYDDTEVVFHGALSL